MKILAVAEFDPAAVLTGHRRAMRALGVDYRLAIQSTYAHAIEADYRLGAPEDRGGLLDFAASCDLVIANPAIWPWVPGDGVPGLSVGEGGWDVIGLAPGRRLAYFHGSRNAWAHRRFYTNHYREQGFRLAASTLDYCAEMNASYLPPLLPVAEGGSAAHEEGAPVVVVHTPTDPDFCHTEIFKATALRAGVVPIVITGRPHHHVMELKRTAHAGFDHLRGAFSVNTLENAALGLAPVVGLREAYLPHLADLEIPQPPFGLRAVGDLGPALRRMRDHATLEGQRRAARRWFEEEFSAPALGRRVKAFLEDA